VFIYLLRSSAAIFCRVAQHKIIITHPPFHFARKLSSILQGFIFSTNYFIFWIFPGGWLHPITPPPNGHMIPVGPGACSWGGCRPAWSRAAWSRATYLAKVASLPTLFSLCDSFHEMRTMPDPTAHPTTCPPARPIRPPVRPPALRAHAGPWGPWGPLGQWDSWAVHAMRRHVEGWHAHPEQVHKPVLNILVTSSLLEGILQHPCNIQVSSLRQEGDLHLF
jgi:hypothetical protein